MINPLPALKAAEKRFNWHKHILRDDLRLRWTWSHGKDPVVVYSMPKTASASVYKALRETRGVFALKSHTLRPEHWRPTRTSPAWMPGWSGMWRDHWHSDRLLHQKMILPKRPGRFISLVRDPIATNVSAFFYFNVNWFRDLPTTPDLSAMSDDELLGSFMERYPHHVTTDWFDLEPRETLGIDVYSEPFPHDRGVVELVRGGFRMLVLRTDLDDGIKGEAISDFVGVEGVTIPRHNTSSHYGLRELHRRLHAGITACPDYIDRMLEHRFTRHFWTDAERAGMRARWSTLPD